VGNGLIEQNTRKMLSQTATSSDDTLIVRKNCQQNITPASMPFMLKASIGHRFNHALQVEHALYGTIIQRVLQGQETSPRSVRLAP
jgi:hypothetical protein